MLSDSNNYWKQRAIDRRMDNKSVKKRVKELTISRDSWKAKYMQAKEEKLVYRKELQTIKKNSTH